MPQQRRKLPRPNGRRPIRSWLKSSTASWKAGCRRSILQPLSRKQVQPHGLQPGAVLAAMAGKVENLIVASADLSNSDKTDSYLKKTTAFKRGDFSGSFLQAGVAELTMAAIANGMALHGGVIPVIGTFFVFSDYMKPAVRMAALMELPVKYVWTHDAFRVGEDGPTHQPVEQEAQIRLLEHLRNHHGNRSLMVLRPADANEATVAWKMALENTKTPTALILSRQGIADLPARDRIGPLYAMPFRQKKVPTWSRIVKARPMW